MIIVGDESMTVHRCEVQFLMYKNIKASPKLALPMSGYHNSAHGCYKRAQWPITMLLGLRSLQPTYKRNLSVLSTGVYIIASSESNPCRQQIQSSLLWWMIQT
jgi:hypothetical protein